MATLTVEDTKAEARAKVMDAVEDAKRAVVRGKHQLEDLRDTAAYRVKKAPLMSVGMGFGAGILIGAVAGIVAVKACKR
jgi:ElaB/YqjD/DUF883 family membrane-anchored ribosome-binding protein